MEREQRGARQQALPLVLGRRSRTKKRAYAIFEGRKGHPRCINRECCEIHRRKATSSLWSVYKKKADGINQLTNGLEVTVDDLENRVRSIDKATNAVASTQPTVSSTAAAIYTSTLEYANDATATSSCPDPASACSASDATETSSSSYPAC